MDCFAEPVIGRAFARPGGSNDDWEGRVRCLPLMLAVHVVDHDTQKRIEDGVMVGVRTTITY